MVTIENPRHVTSSLVLYVNGQKVVEDNADPEWTLIYYLRKKLKLCGTKLGCAEGGCGACTVMVSKFNRKLNKISHLAVNACLAPLASMHGLSVTTVEGIGSVKSRLHPVQERIARAHGSQCGFCTPGIVMSMYTLIRNNPKPNMDEIEEAFQGNLCRCTGYRPIIEGFATFSPQNLTCGLGSGCCRSGNKNGGISEESNTINSTKVNGELHEEINKVEATKMNGGLHEKTDKLEATKVNGKGFKDNLFEPTSFTPHHPSQELIFPPELKISDYLDTQYLMIKGPRATWYRPTTLKDLLNLKNEFPQGKIIGGNTEIGIEVKFKNCHYPVLIASSGVQEIAEIIYRTTLESVKGEFIKIGAGVTLSDLQEVLREVINLEPDYRTGIFREIDEMMEVFAGKQIRNVAAIGGNIMTGSPISDLNPILMASSSYLEVMKFNDPNSKRVLMDSSFWTGYRKNVIQPNEVLTAIYIPYTEKNTYFKAYKQSKRREDDIAIVNSAFFLKLNDRDEVLQMKMAFGGMAPVTKLAEKASSVLLSKKWNSSSVEGAMKVLAEELPLDDGAPGGMIRYRKTLTLSFLFKFFMDSSKEMLGQRPIKHEKRAPNHSQYFSMRSDGEHKSDLVGRPIVHLSAFKQATGEAVYCDDMPPFDDELYCAFVVSTRAHAKLVSIDPSPAYKLQGVVGFFSASDIPPERNLCGVPIMDEEIFASEKVICEGQVIGCVAATELSIAQKAAKLVQIEYEDISPRIITIEEAIAAKSFFGEPKIMRQGDAEKVISEHPPTLTVEGSMRVGGQEHFYLETQNTVVVPGKEDDEITVYAATQSQHDVQERVAFALGIPENRVVCKVRRLGGGFGGKETKSVILAVPVAIVAKKLGRPVRLSLDRDEDMAITGQRHPFLGRYKAAFTEDGKILALDLQLYSNAGCTTDLSVAVMLKAMGSVPNAVHIPHITCRGFVCRTNLPSYTAFRGFGAPQAALIVTNVIEQIAHSLGEDANTIYEKNFYKDGDMTFVGERIVDSLLERCWTECLKMSQFTAQQQEVAEFNRKNRFKKRGISCVPLQWGVGFEVSVLEQAGALIMIYTDGSLLINHGGVEMGQGLHTKMVQVVSRCLGVPADLIHTSEVSSDKVPNTTATAASVSSDMNGMALVDACNKILDRLKPIKEKNPNGTWKEWIKTAYVERVSLAATGFYKSKNKQKGNQHMYMSYGAACSQVEIDCLTGAHRVLRTDIVMDVGESLNPAIDVGQIEGAFMQGYGMVTMEEPVVSPSGRIYTRGPGNYKIPGFGDIPVEFNVCLLKGSTNVHAVYSSKAIGEPPLVFCTTVFFAIKNAIQAARDQENRRSWFQLDSPATSARIRMACEDSLTSQVPETNADVTPWNIDP